MKFIHSFFLSVLLTFLLLLSGQVFATTYYSKTSGDWLATSTWKIASSCIATGTVGTTPDSGDELIICSGTTVTVGAVSVGLNATVESGGTLDLSSNVLTLSGALTNNGGTILSDVQAFVAQSIIHNAGTTNLAGVTTNTTNLITVNGNGAGLMLSASLIAINSLFISNTNFSMPTTVLSLTGGIAVTSGTLALGINNVVTGNVVVNTGASVTGLNQTIGSGTYTTGASSTSTPPSCVGTLVISTAGAYDCVPFPGFSISAPIFSTKEKARVFIEEVR